MTALEQWERAERAREWFGDWPKREDDPDERRRARDVNEEITWEDVEKWRLG